MVMPRLNIELLLPWIEVRHSRSPGPGGQNVNKVSTRVTVLFDFATCTELTAWQKVRVRQGLATRISRDGRLRVVSHRERTQRRNRAAALERMVELLTEATHRRKPRRKTKPTVGSKRRRLATKRQRSEVKQRRGRVADE